MEPRHWELGPFLVTGATGKQGGATARSLLAKGANVHALVRDPQAEKAVALKELGIILVRGDLDDARSLEAACRGIYGVFSIQNPDYADLGSDVELVRARTLIESAHHAGVTHFVQSSVTGAGDHYRAATAWREQHGELNSLLLKGRIEDLVRQAGFAYWTILKPGFFMENLPFMLAGDRLVSTYAADTPIPTIAVDDIGEAAAAAFADREKFNHASVELAGDLLTMRAIAKILSASWARDIQAPRMTPDEAVALGLFPEMIQGQAWANEVGMPARPDVTRAWGLTPHDLEQWADSHRQERGMAP